MGVMIDELAELGILGTGVKEVAVKIDEILENTDIVIDDLTGTAVYDEVSGNTTVSFEVGGAPVELEWIQKNLAELYPSATDYIAGTASPQQRRISLDPADTTNKTWIIPETTAGQYDGYFVVVTAKYNPTTNS